MISFPLPLLAFALGAAGLIGLGPVYEPLVTTVAVIAVVASEARGAWR